MWKKLTEYSFELVLLLYLLLIAAKYSHCQSEFKCREISGEGIAPYAELTVDGQKVNRRFENNLKCLDEVKRRIKKGVKDEKKHPRKRNK